MTGGGEMKKQISVKKISFAGALLLGINGIIGSGIFLLPGHLFQEAGSYSILAILFAGLATLMIALNYAVMASKMDDDGGAWTYAYRAFGSLAGFQTGWFGWFLGVITISAEIAAFLTTLAGFMPLTSQSLTYKLIALSIITMIGIINLFGPSFVTYLDDLSSALKVVILCIFIIAGAVALSHFKVTFGHHATTGHGFTGAFVTAFYMFTGFSFLPNVAGQMKNAAKALPRVIIITMIAVSLIYVTTQTVTIEFLGNSLAGEKLPVAAAFGIIGGQMGQSLILSGMLVSILGVAIAVSFDTPVELASMAREHQLMPDWLARQNRYGAPYWAIILTTALAGGLVVSGEYIFLVKLIVFSSFIQYIATIASLIKLRNDQTLGVGMRLPGGLLLPIASLLLITYLLTSFAMVTVLIGLGFAAVGLVIHEVERAIKQKNK